ncbi:hypothetical protein [Variovorax sp. PBL-E5]|uniref:hypothetical protein n=1 Tax=Variovorax sp. PBL-E5 TaxID=434014 RepID=UPI0013162027|nr:hypothetical protein [Variovorax sp. PBL-E5]VTU36967.1 hypothetical protein E5CHR_04450 [Variovorax sp. PBL-E5]
MRIRDYVNTHGVDAFNRDDFFFVGSKVSNDPARLVLVGGQAIEAWGLYFKVLAPSGDVQPLTEDTDWFGKKESAIWLCKQLGRDNTDLQLASPEDPSPNTAVAFHKRPDGRVVLIDFLKSLVGLDPKAIVERAVPVQVGPVHLYILHPLLCLESRLANLAHLPAKRNSNGVMQAQWAINIVAAYLRQLVEIAPMREAMTACREVSEAAEYRAGPYCYDEFNIDPLQAITRELLERIGGLFSTEDWPRRLARIDKQRAKRAARVIARQQIVSYKFTLTPPTKPQKA